MPNKRKINNVLSKWLLSFLFLIIISHLYQIPVIADNIIEKNYTSGWRVFTHGSIVYDMSLSEDGQYVWVGTIGGLEKRDAETGKLIKVYTTADGLPNNEILVTESDGDGGVWLGTRKTFVSGKGGLVHFLKDETVQLFNTDNSELPDNKVNAILRDANNGIWIGTNNGMAYYQKKENKWRVLTESNSDIPENIITCLAFDNAKNGIWVGTENNGLGYYDKVDSWIHFNIDNSTIPDNSISSLATDENSGIWVGTRKKGFAYYNNEKWENFNNQNSLIAEIWIYSLATDENGGIWLGTAWEGIYHYKSDGTWEYYNTDNSNIPDNSINSILHSEKSGLWIGTQAGIAILDKNNLWKTIINDSSKLPGDNVISIANDLNNGIWVGTGSIDISGMGSIANFKSDGSWNILDINASGIINTDINTVTSDDNGGVWIGTWDGLIHYKSNSILEAFSITKSDIYDNSVKAIISDGSGGIWAGWNGLAHYSADKKWTILNLNNSQLPYKYNKIESLFLDKKGQLWIGTWSGFSSYSSENGWKTFNSENSPFTEHIPVTSICSDGKDGLWIGTGEAGLFHYTSNHTWEIFNTSNSPLQSNSINSLAPAHNSSIWIGSGSISESGLNLSGGLNYYQPEIGWQYFNTANSGLPSYMVKTLLPDGSGGIFIGTLYGGLAHFSPIGIPKQFVNNSYEIMLTWFLNRSPFENMNVKYIEIQRAIAKESPYETVRDSNDNPIRFYADYTECQNPRIENCWPRLEQHDHSTIGDNDTQSKGYTLNTPITDPEWLEGLPRYYRLSAVIEEDGKLFRVANNQEAVLITPQVEEKPRVELTLDKNAIAMLPNQKAEITIFVSSLDLFRGDVTLEIESATGNTISNNINVKLEPAAVSLKAGETKPVLLTIDALSENTQNIKIIPTIQSGYSGKSASLNVQVGDGTTPMIALSIAHKTKRTRVLDALTVSGNVIPAQAGQQVVVSGNNIMESVESTNSAESAIFTTDENGYFQDSVTPIQAGLLTLTAQSNGITSNNAEIFILPARTNIALSSNVNQSTKKGDILRVQGIITPVRLDGTKVNLDIRYLDPANQDAGLQPQFVGGVEIDAKGVFYRDVVVPGNGFINVNASLPETSDYLSINIKIVIPIGQPVGEGIILVSESGDVDFQTISKNLGNYVYNALKSRNIPAERIKYLGIADDPEFTNGTANKANLHDALTNWATTLFSTDDPYKTPLNLYLIGKVEDGSFRLNDNEVLTADELAQYLNEAEEILKTNSKDNYSEYKGFPVTIVLEGTQSGKWIEKIAGNGRIILTSSSDKPVDEGGFAGYDNLGESSFSRYFYEFINYGSDIEGSFAEANYEILKFYRHTQRPVMDADGDGVGTTNYDRYEASGKFIEYRPSGNLRPQIRTTNPDMTINRADAQNNFLWAIATDPENEMQGVFCSINDPSNKTVNIEMKPNIDNKNAYEIDLNQTYPNLGTGCYQAVYYAKDKAGNVSLPEQKYLNVISSNADQGGGGIPNPPQFTISVDDHSSMVTISWSEVPNADGYKLFYAPYPNPEPSAIGEIDMGKQREITFDGKGFAFYAAVKAYNNNGLSGLSNIEFFDLR
ncbi:MAG: hypothetical protein HQK64_09705 [Desulfamplus sp.]|nr:hypothetical protein [Desulfamplus sp.]